MIETLQQWAADRGYRVAWGPVEVVVQAWVAITGFRDSGALDGGLFTAELAPAVAVDGGFEGDTVVVVAKPSPAFRVGFELDGGELEAILPPTYVRYRPTFEEVRQDLAAHGLPGARVEVLTAPLKAVAARLGLVRYGRNNITYAPGIGSYLQLAGYVTDARLEAPDGGHARGPELLAECDACDACQRACPTGAIAADRVLLRAERCLTLANESPGAWPAWVPERSHHCLLGCLVCQRVCPANPRLPIEASGVVFSAHETRTLLADGQPREDRAENGIRAKLAWLGQPSSEPILGRNLRALTCRRPTRRTAGSPSRR